MDKSREWLPRFQQNGARNQNKTQCKTSIPGHELAAKTNLKPPPYLAVIANARRCASTKSPSLQVFSVPCLTGLPRVRLTFRRVWHRVAFRLSDTYSSHAQAILSAGLCHLLRLQQFSKGRQQLSIPCLYLADGEYHTFVDTHGRLKKGKTAERGWYNLKNE